MKCEAARRYLGPYLDSELDARTSFEIARHLEACPDCADRFEKEQGVEHALADVLRRPEPGDDAIWARALSRAAPRRLRWVAGLAAVALVVFLASGWLFRGDLADDLRNDYAGIEAGTTHLGIASSDPFEVGAWLESRVGFPVALPSDLEAVLRGGRKCEIRGTPTAFLLYEVEGGPVAVCLFPAERWSVETPLMDDGAVRVAAIRSGGRIVGATGRLPCERLLALCRSIAGAPPAE